MIILLDEFRKRYHLTQREMANELNLKPGTYAMIERGDREFPKSLHKAFEALKEKYQANSTLPVTITEAADIAALRALAQGKSLAGIRIEEARCSVEIVSLTRTLQSYKARFRKAKSVVEMVDAQLLQIDEKLPTGSLW